LIHASSRSIDGAGGVLGQAGPDAFRSGSRLPYHGVMQFDSADMAAMERGGTLLGVVIHEIGHILGIGTIWQGLGLVSGAGTSNPIFRGAQATAAYNQLFRTAASGVPVENTGGAGTRDSHWRESIFRNEIMTGWIGPGTNLPISRITVASLADIGYQVNYAMADSFTPSSTSLAVAASLSSGTTSAKQLFAAGAESLVDRTSAANKLIHPMVAQAGRRQELEPAPRQFSAATIDVLMTSFWRRNDQGVTPPSDHHDNPDGADISLAWAALDREWAAWRWLALT
jgi:hypothetical protein